MKDSAELLAKTIKRNEKKKQQSKKKWDERIAAQEKSKEDRQKKRKANIKGKKDQKKEKKLNRLAKRGKIIVWSIGMISIQYLPVYLYLVKLVQRI